jgi:hypothetical protein
MSLNTIQSVLEPVFSDPIASVPGAVNILPPYSHYGRNRKLAERNHEPEAGGALRDRAPEREVFALGQNRKSSTRVDVFRCSPNNGLQPRSATRIVSESVVPVDDLKYLYPLAVLSRRRRRYLEF